MRLFAIGDLHLSGGDNKPMDVFGPQWDRHFFRIRENWIRDVRDEDAVLIPGDISWAMQLKDAQDDLEEIGQLPGRKILCKGNHDYWWSSVSRVRDILPDSMTALQHSAVDLGETVVCGTRGWTVPMDEMPLSAQDEKIYRRETERMRLALDEAAAMAGGRPLIAMMHYPPLYAGGQETVFSQMMEEYGVHTVVYGHLHGAGIPNGYAGEKNGVRYYLVSCDSICFSPKEIYP